jgi:amino acid transporter
MELFAQLVTAQQRRGVGVIPADLIITILAVLGVLLVVVLVVYIFFLLSVSNCFKQIARRNRQMEPGQVWLCLIPLFGTVWHFLMLFKLADSLAAEYRDRRLPPEGDFGKTLAIVELVTAFLCGPVYYIVAIFNWVKIVGYTRQLRMDSGTSDTGDFDDRDDDHDSDEDRGGKTWDKNRR